jgi:hypothetical protein
LLDLPSLLSSDIKSERAVVSKLSKIFTGAALVREPTTNMQVIRFRTFRPFASPIFHLKN